MFQTLKDAFRPVGSDESRMGGYLARTPESYEQKRNIVHFMVVFATKKTCMNRLEMRKKDGTVM